ncbi:hypothetical protein E2320_017860 [Naja naja]|nr:hypothetical protein E2320_017860 [Naja naja]
METMEFLMKKSEDMKGKIKSAKDQLSASGMDASLTHESLVTLSEEALEAEFSAKVDMAAVAVTLPTKRPFV